MNWLTSHRTETDKRRGEAMGGPHQQGEGGGGGGDLEDHEGIPATAPDPFTIALRHLLHQKVIYRVSHNTGHPKIWLSPWPFINTKWTLHCTEEGVKMENQKENKLFCKISNFHA